MMMTNFKRSKTKVLQLKAWGTFCLIGLTFLVYIIESRSGIDYNIIQIKDGYGYQVYRSKKLIIQQDFVPTKIGFKPFETKEQAEKAAKIVVEKLNNKQVPALSKKEIETIIR